jgi:hypothetical protein
MSAGLITDGRPHWFWNARQIGEKALEAAMAERCVASDRCVQLLYIAGVVLVMVEMHGLGVDEGLQSIVAIGQCRQNKGRGGRESGCERYWRLYRRLRERTRREFSED